jgi:hypothetical protein
MPTKSPMEALPSSTDSRISLAGFVAAKGHLKLRPQQIFGLLAERRDTTDEELELIDKSGQDCHARHNRKVAVP